MNKNSGFHPYEEQDDNAKNDDFSITFDASWIGIGVAFAVFFPLGLYLLFRKFRGVSIPLKGRRIFNILGIGALALGTYHIIDTVAEGALALSDVYVGASFAVGGALMLGANRMMQRRERRFQSYKAIVGSKDAVSFETFSKALSKSTRRVVRDLRTMVSKGLFGAAAYLDMGSRNLMLHVDATPQKDSKAEQEQKQQKKPKQQAQPKDEYDAILLEIRDLNDRIKDIEISRKIYTIETLADKIFRVVRERPQKLSEIRTFMNYYLPTTLKLLRAYAEFEEQGIEGENIADAKRSIEAMMERLSEGFTQQLDMLYSSQVVDINADISVLEQMMARDGLIK